MKGMHGIIFSYEKRTDLRELIADRIHGSIPFAGDYRVIDFVLSAMVNAGITDVGVIMHGKCQSMLDHLGSGKSCDELCAELSKKPGEEGFYLEKDRQYRSENDVFEDYTDEERSKFFGSPCHRLGKLQGFRCLSGKGGRADRR